MTGDQHYLKAEELSQRGASNESLMRAQVHATLALAAAVEKQTRYAHGADSGGYGAPVDFKPIEQPGGGGAVCPCGGRAEWDGPTDPDWLADWQAAHADCEPT